MAKKPIHAVMLPRYLQKGAWKRYFPQYATILPAQELDNDLLTKLKKYKLPANPMVCRTLAQASKGGSGHLITCFLCVLPLDLNASCKSVHKIYNIRNFSTKTRS